MEKRLFTLCLAFLFIRNVFADEIFSAAEASDVFKQVKQATAQASSLWEIDLNAPILLVDPKTRHIFANQRDEKGVLQKNASIYTGKLPDDVNIANTSVYWSDTHWAMILLPLPSEQQDRINLIAHELFHRAQSSLGFVSNNPDNAHLEKKEARILLRLELEALKSALEAQKPTDVLHHLTSAFQFRKARHDRFADSMQSENQLELNEGLAEYSGLSVSKRSRLNLVGHLISKINQFIESPSYVRSFAYVTTPVYGTLLKVRNPHWTRDIKSSTDLSDYFLQAFQLSLKPIAAEQLFLLGNQYNGKVTRSQEEERSLTIRRTIEQYKHQLVNNPHLNILLENMSISFNPGNLVSIENVGTVYPTMRISDNWGVLTVTQNALMSQDWSQVSVSKPTQVSTSHAKGDGWTLELKNGYHVVKDDSGDNYSLLKRISSNQ